MRIAINGFGRIGRAFLRQALEEPNLEIVAINDLGDLANLVYLLEFDSVYRHYSKSISTKIISNKAEKGKIIIEGKEILFFQEKDPKNLPWKDLKIDVVVESTGHFTEYQKAKAHLEAGAKKVVISAPAKGEEGKDGRTILLGINEEEQSNFSIISNGSCTTNAVAPAIQVLEDKIGIKKAILNTIHANTATQAIVDRPNTKDWRRGRAAKESIIPSTTGAAKCVTKVIPVLGDKFDGIALRVPVVCGSIADITFITKEPTTREKINQAFIDASKEKRWFDILGVTEQPIVSRDIIQNPTPATVDLNFTRVVDGDLVKILVWYDNEWGYAWTLKEHVKRIIL